MKKIIFSMFFLLALASICFSATITVESPYGRTEVIAAITAASSGDTVYIPACDVTWDGVQLTMLSSKPITLQGSGDATTKITSINTTLGVIGAHRITGIQFILNGTSANGQLLVKGAGWRIDHCTFTSLTGTSRMSIFVNSTNISTYPKGLIDNNLFTDGRIVIAFTDQISEARYRRHLPLSSLIGTEDNVFVEDNIFTKSAISNVIDASNLTGAYVARFNTVIGPANIFIHPFATATNRGPTHWEIYGNTLNAGDEVWDFAGAFIRAGTGMIFNNAWTNFGYEVGFDNLRTETSITTAGLCNGSSPWDGNDLANGWPCRDQIGRGPDITLATDASPYPDQESAPAYLWGNTGDGSSASVRSINNSADWIAANRDYYNEAADFDGTVGVGSGLKAAMPATCTTGVGYWATDEADWNTLEAGADGQLYKCTSTDTWELYYTPYAYPHPLQGRSTISGNIIGDLGLTEDEIVSGGQTFTINLTDTTWVADVVSDAAKKAALIAGITGNSADVTGWNAEVTITDVVRTSDAIVTVTLPASTGYDITTPEVVSVQIAAALNAANEIINAIPNITIDIMTPTPPSGSAKASVGRGGSSAKGGALGGPSAAQISGN